VRKIIGLCLIVAFIRWLMSEKMDGIRCYWSGTKLYTRTGKDIFAQKEWIKNLPLMAIDGELWTSRDDF